MKVKDNNIAIVVYSHFSRDARVRRYAESLARKGYWVDVVCLKENYSPKEPNISLFMYPLGRRRLGWLWYIFEYISFFLYSTYILSKKSFYRKYKAVHINNMPDFLIFSSFIPKSLGTKVILDLHDPMPELYMSKYHTDKNNLTVRLLCRLEGISMGFADKILTANESFRSIFLQRHPEIKGKISVILNCPDPRIFNSQHSTNNIKRKSDNSQLIPPQRDPASGGTTLHPQQFILMYMGTVEKRFGLDIVIGALPELIKKIPNIKFVLIPKIEDEGKYFHNFKFQISNFKLEKYVQILPPLPLEKIADKLQEADIGIVLAKNGVFTENIFPVKLLEFIQMGIPVIATRTKTLAGFFDDRQIAFLKENSPEEFARIVLNLYKHPEIRSVLAKRACKYLKTYNWEKEEKKYLEIADTLIRDLDRSSLVSMMLF
ncbi:glycosyltransferase family 4 protein [Patescibacteria group bacterium]|nr:glycosyltransferase family 4 protein [Patescibacteria group bacterium]